MRRILLATTAIIALALGTPVALAQSSNAPSGALEEQKQPPRKSGKTATPTMPGRGTQNGSPAGPRAEAPEATPNGAKHPTHQAQQEQPSAEPPKAQQRTKQAQQAQPTPQQPKAQERLNGQARPQTPGTTGEFNYAPRNDQRPAAAARTDQGNRSSAPGNAGGREQVQVSDHQRTQIHERIGHIRIQRLNRADFSLQVGAAVPRSVRLYTLPPEIVEIVPEYSGYDYVLVGDDIVIIDPDSHEIVAVIPA